MQNSKLVIRQFDNKISNLAKLKTFPIISDGWVNLIRKTLNMSLRQLGDRLSVTPQSARSLEKREKQGTVTLATLRDVADALDMQLVYGFVPKDGSLEKMIEKKARQVATNIVKRTSLTMKLEDQENSSERIKQAIEDLTEQLQREMPKSLWDE